MSRAASSNRKKIGVVLFQLGGPDSLEAVEPFLYNLFSDPDIIEFPFARFARQPLARLLAARRAKKVQHAYAELGGKSPLNEITQRQAQALEKQLRKDCEARVVVAMRYWHPFTQEALQTLAPHTCTELVLLPLYPQYSKVTTGSSLNEWNRHYARFAKNHIPVHLVRHFYDHPGYLDAVVERIEQTLEQFSATGRVELVFSAHGIPADVIVQGDPYRDQVEATMARVMSRGGWHHPYRLCYQSRVGPGRWLEPSLQATLRALPSQGAENVLVIPIAFVSDHIETLHEIDVEARALAHALGIPRFALMPALNDSPKFIRALADLVRVAVAASGAATTA
ncbi:MAG: ferrochelatase [Terriglobia bacterium]